MKKMLYLIFIVLLLATVSCEVEELPSPDADIVQTNSEGDDDQDPIIQD